MVPPILFVFSRCHIFHHCSRLHSRNLTDKNLPNHIQPSIFPLVSLAPFLSSSDPDKKNSSWWQAGAVHNLHKEQHSVLGQCRAPVGTRYVLHYTWSCIYIYICILYACICIIIYNLYIYIYIMYVCKYISLHIFTCDSDWCNNLWFPNGTSMKKACSSLLTPRQVLFVPIKPVHQKGAILTWSPLGLASKHRPNVSEIMAEIVLNMSKWRNHRIRLDK